MRRSALTFLVVLSTALGCAVSNSPGSDAQAMDASGTAGTGGAGRGGTGGRGGSAGGSTGRGGTAGGYDGGAGSDGGVAGAAGGVAGAGGGSAGAGGGVIVGSGGSTAGSGGSTAGSGGSGGSPPVPVTLTAAKAGNGAGTITSTPAGINCGSDCSEPYNTGSMVTLTAAADTSSTFTGWSGGGCTGTAACAVTLNAATTVTATFTLKTWPVAVTLAGTGGGTVTSTPAGINCGATCSASYDHGTLVTLSAAPNGQSLFTGWGGACTGSGTCTVTADQARTVTATFTLQTYGLTVTKAGTGAALGSVTSTPAGINCGTDCSEAFPVNTMVTLTAAASTGATFAGWGGACTGSATCMVTISAIVNVTATFTLNQYTLMVSKGGNGTGTVTSSPAGINCGSTCGATVNHNGMVTLTATPGTGSTFTGWSGGGCTGTSTCTVAVTAATTVTATFTLSQYALTVTKAGGGTGTVTSSPSGTNCGSTCSASYNHGTMITLTAAADTSSNFAGWSGGGCTGTSTCTVTIAGATGVTATFSQKTYTLTVMRTGDGSGTIGIAPSSSTCSATSCSYTVAHGVAISLTANPASGSTFEGWSGGGCTGTGACSVTVTANTTVTGTFTLSNRTLSIDFQGGASGTIAVTPGTTTFTADGMMTVANHSMVTLTWTTTGGVGFGGWGGACSGFGDTCTLTLNANASVTVTFDRPNRAFVTSTTHRPGELGGLAGADAICAARATAGGLTGTFRALLGTASATAWARLNGARGWARLDNRVFGDEVADISAGRTFYPLIRDENNTEIPDGQTLVVTGAPGGAARTCETWTSTSGGANDAIWGDPWSGYATWFQNGGTSCNSTSTHLYCFEVARNVVVRPQIPTSFRRAFLSAAGVTGSITLAGADARCQTEATAANLPGTYRAMMAGNGTTAASRFSATGAPWFRTDNVQLALTPAALLGGTTMPMAALSLRADGLTHEQALVWTGAASVATAGTAASTCTGWTSTTPTTAVETYGNILTNDWFGRFDNGDCSETHRLFCFQQ